MSDTRDQTQRDSIDQLREHARRLAHELTGTLRRVSVRSGEATIEVEWQTGPGIVPAAVPVAGTGSANGSRAVHGSAAVEPQAEPAVEPEEPGAAVCSPMVGTFYRASRPDEAPFVEVGDEVTEGQTIGIVEAMKLFNPIVADCAGTVTAIPAENASPVEFDQELVRISTGGPDTGAGDADGE